MEQRKTAQLKIEAERKIAQAKVEEERKIAQAKIEEERKARKALEQKSKNQVLKLYKLNYSVQGIVDFLELDEQFVQDVLNNHSEN